MLLWEKVEAIRQEPEHIRRRYAMICVMVSMVFIFGIWLLSIEESVSTAARDLPEAAEKSRDLTGGAPSLNDLLEQSAPLRIEEDMIEGGQFFQEQMKQGGAEGEGMN